MELNKTTRGLLIAELILLVFPPLLLSLVPLFGYLMFLIVIIAIVNFVFIVQHLRHRGKYFILYIALLMLPFAPVLWVFSGISLMC